MKRRRAGSALPVLAVLVLFVAASCPFSQSEQQDRTLAENRPEPQATKPQQDAEANAKESCAKAVQAKYPSYEPWRWPAIRVLSTKQQTIEIVGYVEGKGLQKIGARAGRNGLGPVTEFILSNFKCTVSENKVARLTFDKARR